MITQADIDTLKRIKEHCIGREDNCDGCAFCNHGCNISFPDEWELYKVKPDENGVVEHVRDQPDKTIHIDTMKHMNNIYERAIESRFDKQCEELAKLKESFENLKQELTQFAESLVLTNQNLAKAEERIDILTTEDMIQRNPSLKETGMIADQIKSKKNPLKTMTEATNTEIILHGGTHATPESVHRFFT